MEAKNPIVEVNNYLKWMVEGVNSTTKGIWEIVIDPVNKVIVHFLFKS